jgi:hypothetical protein
LEKNITSIFRVEETSVKAGGKQSWLHGVISQKAVLFNSIQFELLTATLNNLEVSK